MARVKNTMKYMTKSGVMTDAEYKKAVSTLNMRVRRVGNSDYNFFSDTLSEIDKFKTVVTAKSYKGNFNPKMVTKSGNFSTSLKGFTKQEKIAAKEYIKTMLGKTDLTVPELKSKVKKRATDLNTTISKYLKDKEFWKTFGEIKEETQYGSDDVFNAVEITESTNGSYESKKELAKKIIEEYKQWQQDEIDDMETISTMTGEELLNRMNKAVTQKRVNKRSVRKSNFK